MFLEPILHNVDIVMQDENIRNDIHDIDYDISVFRQFKGQFVSRGQISYARLHIVMKNCQTCYWKVSRKPVSRSTICPAKSQLFES